HLHRPRDHGPGLPCVTAASRRGGRADLRSRRRRGGADRGGVGPPPARADPPGPFPGAGGGPAGPPTAPPPFSPPGRRLVRVGGGLVCIMEGGLGVTGALLAAASVATLCGLIHSPLANGAPFWPWAIPIRATAALAGAYGVVAALCWVLVRLPHGSPR